MKINLILMILFILSQSISAFAVYEIVETRRNITLSDDEIPFKDFYIKSTEPLNTLKKNLIVKAVRKIQIKDSQQKSIGEIKTPVGLIKIIYVEGLISIGRQVKLLPRTNLPMLDQIGIMSGDEIDLSESYFDKSSEKITQTALQKKPIMETSQTSDQIVSKKSENKSLSTTDRTPASALPTESFHKLNYPPVDQIKIISIHSVQRDI